MILNIRRMKEEDIDHVYSIEANAHITPWSRELLRDCVLVGYDCRVLELSTNNSNVLGGYIISRLNQNKCHIINFCIAKPLQAKGLGRKLLQTVLYSLAKFTPTHSVTLEVRASNAVALHLYESLGFKKISVKKAYYKDTHPERQEDAIVLEKELVS